ncbi:MAG: hypothetical protein CMP66_00590 [Flavobacteriales bacterium]|nr:hypothetical protein [Flavobacteriales bacterium]
MLSVRTILLFSILVIATLHNSYLGTLGLLDFSLPLILVISVNIITNFSFSPKEIILFILSTLTIVFSVLANYTTLHLGGYNSAVFSIVLLLMLSVNLKEIDRPLFNKLLLLYLLVVSFLGMWFWYKGIYFADFFIWRDGQFFAGGKMAIGFFLNPNRAGAFFVLCFFLSLFFVESKFWRIALLLINLFLVVFSYSRGSMLALLFGGLYYFAVRSTNVISVLKFYSSIVISGTLAILAMLRWFPGEIKGILFKLTSFGSSNRFYLWETVMQEATSSLQRILFGLGPSTTTVNGFSAHNSYINEFSNLGLLFLIAIMFYLLSLIYDSLRDKNYQFLAFVIVAFVLGSVETMLFVDPTMLWVGLILIKLISFKEKELLNT